MYRAVRNGVEKRIESWKIVVPLADNEKRPFPGTVIEMVISRVSTEFGGLTSCNVVGYWKSQGQIFDDESIQMTVDIPVTEHELAVDFFARLKEDLRRQLEQEKVYVTFQNESSELLSPTEFFQELGYEIPSGQPLTFTQEEIDSLVKQSSKLTERVGYETVRLERDIEAKKIIWEREILGLKVSTEIEDEYPSDAVILSADKLETYFKKGVFGKPLVVVGDYEYQSWVLDRERRRYIVGDPDSFSQYDRGDEEPLYAHDWHGILRTSEFIPTFVEQILVNYTILRELVGQEEKVQVTVGSDGSFQSLGDMLLLCPASIPDEEIQKVIIDTFIKAKDLYESGRIDNIALMQAKVMNRYNEKRAMIMGFRKADP